jgi:hypothetical protein
VARKKKKHICAECGESFNHGIGLRKHQRQSGHKGSKIVEEGDDADAPEADEPAAVAAPEPEPEPPPAKARQSSPRRKESPVAQEPSPVVEAPVASPRAAAIEDDDDGDGDDQTVAVPRPSQPAATGTVQRTPHESGLLQHQGVSPTKMQHTKRKINLVSSGLKVVLSARAKDAGQQLKKSARSGADIFKEALKLAVALVCLLAVPTIVFFWFKSHSKAPTQSPDRPAVFSFDDGALAARSTLLRYLDHLGKRQWDEAYGLLSPGWQNDLDTSSFRDAFLDIEDVRWAVSDQRLNSNGDADVLVRLAYREGGKNRRFLGRFRLHKSTQGWRIDRAELSPDRTS